MNKSLKSWVIYSLSDPRTDQVRYVGWAFLLNRRIAQHIQRARQERTHKANWLNQLGSLGLKPIVQELEDGTGDWAEAERKWISHFRDLGCDLTNLTDGGEGVPGLVFSDESKAKMSLAKVGRKLGPEHIQKVADALRGRKRPEHVNAITSATHKGKVTPPEVRQKLSQARKGIRHTEETKAKIASAGIGRKHTEEAKAKQRAAKIGKPLSEEHRRKLSEAKLGRTLSEEHKAKIKRASGGWKHTPETIARITAARRSRIPR